MAIYSASSVRASRINERMYITADTQAGETRLQLLPRPAIVRITVLPSCGIPSPRAEKIPE